MTIRASTVEEHQFGVVRRRGYDRREVDAVMDRLAATMRDHEARTAALEQRLAEADESVDAIRQTFLAAQRTKEAMVAEGVAEAVRIREETAAETTAARERAQHDAAAILLEAGEAASLAAADAEGIRADAFSLLASLAASGERYADDVRALAEANLAWAQIEATRSLGVAAGEAAALLQARRFEAGEATDAARADAAEIVEQAEGSALGLKEAARLEAAAIIADAHREEERLTAHLGALRLAVREVEQRVDALARSTRVRTQTIGDLIDRGELESTDDGERVGKTRTIVSGGSEASTIVQAEDAVHNDVVYLAALGRETLEEDLQEDRSGSRERRPASLRERIERANKDNRDTGS